MNHLNLSDHDADLNNDDGKSFVHRRAELNFDKICNNVIKDDEAVSQHNVCHEEMLVNVSWNEAVAVYLLNVAKVSTYIRIIYPLYVPDWIVQYAIEKLKNYKNKQQKIELETLSDASGYKLATRLVQSTIPNAAAMSVLLFPNRKRSRTRPTRQKLQQKLQDLC